MPTFPACFPVFFDLFYPHPSKPTFDLFLTYFNVFGASGPLGRLLLLKIRDLVRRVAWGKSHVARSGESGSLMSVPLSLRDLKPNFKEADRGQKWTLQKHLFGRHEFSRFSFAFAFVMIMLWETDFYTPPVLGGAALLPFSAPAVYKNPVA